MKISIGKNDYIWSYLAYFFRFGVSLFIFPVVLKLFSSAEYGLWVTFTSLGTIVNLFDFGFSSTLLRNMTYVWGGAQKLQPEGCILANDKSVRNDRLFILTFRTCQKIYLVIALLALLISYTLGLAYIKYIVRDIFKPDYIIAWLIYGTNISINLYYAYWSVSLRSVGAVRQSQKAILIGSIIQLIISYIGLLAGWGILALSIAGCISGIIIRVVSKVYFTHYKDIGNILQKYSESIKKEELSGVFKIVWHNAKKAGISSIATVALTQCTTLIISAYFGVAITGEYGLCLQLLSILSGVSQIYYQTTIPKITQLRQQNNLFECQKQFSLSITIAWFIFGLGFFFVVLLGTPLLHIIKSQTHLNIMLFMAMAFFTFGEMEYSMHASFISLENKLPFVPSVVITAIILVPLSFLVVYSKLGIWGIISVRNITEAAYIFWKWPQVARKQLNMKIVDIIRMGTKEWYSRIKIILC